MLFVFCVVIFVVCFEFVVVAGFFSSSGKGFGDEIGSHSKKSLATLLEAVVRTLN